jgi:hypothetical protein
LVLAATVVGIGLSAGFGTEAAWADTGTAGSSDRSTSASSSESVSRPERASTGHHTHREKGFAGTRTRSQDAARDVQAGPRAPGARAQRAETGTAASPDTTGPAAAGHDEPSEGVPEAASTDETPAEIAEADPVPAAAQQDSTPGTQDEPALAPRRTPPSPELAAHSGSAVSAAAEPVSVTATKAPSRLTALPAAIRVAAIRPPDARSPATAPVRIAAIAADLTARRAAVLTTETTAPSAPEPLSPIAEIAALPGRIVNTVLQALGFTAASDGPRSPFDFAPIDQLLFAAFREVEGVLGLTKPPAVQPVPPTMIYTGPTTDPTPTVAQFLNAATSQYGLGTTPDGLQPLTVNGFQMASLNILSGHSAAAWVTPQQQIIITYQGTTGGTNLLFNPLVAITQLITDLQIIFTGTTPWAFHDALAFERRVEAAAVAQGYSADDIFVTGHSLGGWQAAYVAQQTGLGGIGFESPGLNTTVPGNGADSGFINIATYGDPAVYMSTDLPGLQPFMPAYVPGGGSKPHYGAIVMIGDPDAVVPLFNASALFGKSLLGTLIFIGDFLGRFFQHHLPGMQAYNLDVSPDPGVVPWLGAPMGPVNTGWGELTIPQLKFAASQAGMLVLP